MECLIFTLAILEFTDEITVISLARAEQKYINRFKPEYNLNPLAGNSKGYKHTPESIEKMRKAALGIKHKDEIRKLMSENRKKENNPFYFCLPCFCAAGISCVAFCLFFCLLPLPFAFCCV